MRRHAARRDAVGGGRHRAAVARGANHPVHPAVEAKAVTHHQRGAAQRLGIGRAGLEAVRIRIRAGDGPQPHPVAGDLPDHVAEDGEGRDDKRGGLRQGAAGLQQGHGERGSKQDLTAAHRGLVAT
jgi:hypothetical protein